METLNIALDIEGVLADTHSETARRSDLLDVAPPHEYSFGSEEQLDEYMHVSQNLWHNHNHQIPPLEGGLRETTKELARIHNVDVVTSRTNVDRQLREWLEGYGIHYDELVVTDDSRSDKTAYGDYDAFIDDSPHVAQDVIDANEYVFLRDRPYNKDFTVPWDSSGLVYRVSSVREAVELLSDVQVAHSIKYS